MISNNIPNNLFASKDKGFTLLEVMVAMAILAIALTSLFGSQSTSVALATETRFNIQAPLLARMQLARLQSEKEIFADSGDFGDDFPGFLWKLTIKDSNFQDSETSSLQHLNEKLQHIILVVSWGEERFSYQLDNYRRKDE